MDATWIKSALKGKCCTHCQKPLTHEHVMGVGVIKPPPNQACVFGTKAIVMAICPSCKYVTSVPSEARQKDVEQALVEVYRRAWKEFFEKTGVGKKKAEKDAEKIVNTKLIKPSVREPRAEGRVRPSIQPGAPKKPITDKEQQRFLRRLQRTSMRIKTKSFQDWLRRLTG